ncbi:MAG: hypothetical protein AAB638_01250 [Patescibacteria group bacterium]
MASILFVERHIDYRLSLSKSLLARGHELVWLLDLKTAHTAIKNNIDNSRRFEMVIFSRTACAKGIWLEYARGIRDTGVRVIMLIEEGVRVVPNGDSPLDAILPKSTPKNRIISVAESILRDKLPPRMVAIPVQTSV